MSPQHRAVVVAPVLLRHDAIATAAVNTFRLLAAIPDMQVSILTAYCERSDTPAKVISGLAGLLADPSFLAADLIVYHFGLYNPLFDALLVGNGRAKQVVRFHNVTPAQYLRPQDAPLIWRSLDQICNFRHADAVWADSATNALMLREHGIGEPAVEVIPLVVEAPRRSTLAGKGGNAVEILFLGRFVQSKGVLDLLRAVAVVAGRHGSRFRLRLAGNQTFSHSEYIQEVVRAAKEVACAVEFLGEVDDPTRDRLLQEAHILAAPSYHEGFCKPAIEGLRAGCIPLGYAAYNLPDICNGLGRLVPPGDVAALADALSELIDDITAIMQGRENHRLRLDRGATSIAELDRLIEEYVPRFEFEAVHALTLDCVRRLLPRMRNSGKLSVMRNTLPYIDVRPDDEMRNRERSSLNRLPDLSDWEAGGRLSTIMRDLDETVSIHRKGWEYAMCIHGLDALGVVSPEAVGLAVGAGSERPLYYYANTIRRMVATDLYDTETHEGTPLMLDEPERFAPFPYRRDRLDVVRMPGDQLDFPDASFDFVFCLSSIEHFGSREAQQRALDEMARVLKPRGVACIITELILTDHSDREYFRWEEIEEVFLRHPLLRLEGGNPDLSISESLLAFPVDLTQVTWPLTPATARRLNRSPHVVLKRGDMLWTSFSMFLRRVGGQGVTSSAAVADSAQADDAHVPIQLCCTRDPRTKGSWGEQLVQGQPEEPSGCSEPFVPKTFNDLQSFDELSRVNDAQKAAFTAMVEASGGLLDAQRRSAYLARWREALVHIGSDATVLDIGGGWPIDIVWDEVIGRCHTRYFLADIDPMIITDAKAKLTRYNLSPENAVATINTVLPFDDVSFDAVFSSYCLEHSPQIDMTFQEISRVLRPAGTLVFSVPYGFDDSDEHLICFDIDDWLTATELAGFEVVNYHIGSTYPMTGWDLLVVARHKPEIQDMATLRSLMERFTKAGRTFVAPGSSSFRYFGTVVESRPHRVLSGIGSRAIVESPRGVDAILFLRQPSSGVVELTAGSSHIICDLYSRIPYVKAVALPVSAPAVEIKILGKDRGLEQVVFHGALLAPDRGADPRPASARWSLAR